MSLFSIPKKKIKTLAISSYSSKEVNQYILKEACDYLLLKIKKNDIENESKLKKILFENELKETTLIYEFKIKYGLIYSPNEANYNIEDLTLDEIERYQSFLIDFNLLCENCRLLAVHSQSKLIAILANNLTSLTTTFLYIHPSEFVLSTFLNEFISCQVHQLDSLLFEISTTEYLLQNEMVKLDFQIRETINYYQVNSLLSYSELPEKQFSITITNDQINNFGDLSGDYNPLHFDDDYAKKRGFKSKIAHGLIANSIMSNYFGTNFPGDGTIFLDYKYSFLGPIYPNETYKIVINFPEYQKDKGLYKAIVKIKDANNQYILISINSLLKR